MKLRLLIIKLLEWCIHIATLGMLLMPFTYTMGPDDDSSIVDFHWEKVFWIEAWDYALPVLSFTFQWILLMVLRRRGHRVNFLWVTCWLASMILIFIGAETGSSLLHEGIGLTGALVGAAIGPMFTLLAMINFKLLPTLPNAEPNRSKYE